eukprot:jgi/Psemu1/19037/gm1.19037_g
MEGSNLSVETRATSMSRATDVDEKDARLLILGGQTHAQQTGPAPASATATAMVHYNMGSVDAIHDGPCQMMYYTFTTGSANTLPRTKKTRNILMQNRDADNKNGELTCSEQDHMYEEEQHQGYNLRQNHQTRQYDHIKTAGFTNTMYGLKLCYKQIRETLMRLCELNAGLRALGSQGLEVVKRHNITHSVCAPLIISTMIGACEERDVVTTDIPGAFLQTKDHSGSRHLRLAEKMLDLLLSEIDPRPLQPFLKKVIYGALNAALMFWLELSDDPKSWEFAS